MSDLLVSSHTYTHVTRLSCWSLVRPSTKSRHIKLSKDGQFLGTLPMVAISTTIFMSPWTIQSHTSFTIIKPKPSTERRGLGRAQGMCNYSTDCSSQFFILMRVI